MKISNDTTGNQTRDLPACSAVPQLTVPPHVPIKTIIAVHDSSVVQIRFRAFLTFEHSAGD